jgi:signal transduction histidine kinase
MKHDGPDGLEALIRRVPLFADLGDEEAADLLGEARQIEAAPGETIIEQGTPCDSLYIVLSGALEVTKREGDREVTLAVRQPGDILGEMSLLEQAPRTASVRAVSRSELLVIGPEAILGLLERRPKAAATLLRTAAARLRSTEASLMQSDKLASLGTLAAGLAHELNNPAAAIQRSTGYLNEAFEAWRRRSVELSALDLTEAERQCLADLEQGVSECASTRKPDADARKEEPRLGKRLEELGIDDSWEIAPAMAAFGWTSERLGEVTEMFPGTHLVPVLQWLGAGLAAQQLVEEIGAASKAISEIVRAVKSYAYLDQAPVQDVDLQASLEDTLTILHHKLKLGVAIVRMFEEDLPRIEAYAGELNQVWTNIIDNAIHAMNGKGRLEIAARGLGDAVEVRIADSGPGIPANAAARIFDPFFTTKEQGVGTGLGLHIAHNIVVNRHRGRIAVETRPGRTVFRIVLPLRLGRERAEPAP